MERFQGPLISSSFLGAERLKLEEDEQSMISTLEDSTPFLQMLQSVESPQFIPFKEPSLETLVESCVTHDLVEMQSPLKSESNGLENLCSASGVEKVSYGCNQPEECDKDAIADSYVGWHRGSKTQVGTRERRNRTRTRTRTRTRKIKNKEQIENQRMTHIAVERNRRRQMNDHLSVLKSMMPPSYIQRGDHASIIGGAIDFVKELEQLFQSLEAQKRVRKNQEFGFSGLFEQANCGNDVKAEKKTDVLAVEVTVIQGHVNLKIQCQRRHGQLIKAIVALEDLRLTILHLNITTSEAIVFYTFNLKIEEDSKVDSASEIAEAVDDIFRSINNS